MVHRVGVLGGLGPVATLDFLSWVIRVTPAERDQDHLPMLIDHDPQVPPRQAGPEHDEGQIRRSLRDMAMRLERAGATFLVMPCNTAHAFLDEARAAVSIPFLSIVTAGVDALRRQSTDRQRIGLLATDACLRLRLYQEELTAAGLSPVLLAPASQRRFMDSVFSIKGGERDEKVARSMSELAQELVDAGAEQLLVACTEVPLVLSRAEVPLVSSTEALARETVRVARGERDL